MDSDAKFSTKKPWRSSFSNAQMRLLHQYVEKDSKNETRKINENTKWYETRLDGKNVFVMYSTELEEGPTILYASKGKTATVEKEYLINLLEEYKYGVDEQSKTFGEILGGGWMREMGSVRGDLETVGRGSSVGNASVLQRKSSAKPGADFISNIGDLFKIQGSDRRSSGSDGRLNFETEEVAKTESEIPPAFDEGEPESSKKSDVKALLNFSDKKYLNLKILCPFCYRLSFSGMIQ